MCKPGQPCPEGQDDNEIKAYLDDVAKRVEDAFGNSIFATSINNYMGNTIKVRMMWQMIRETNLKTDLDAAKKDMSKAGISDTIKGIIPIFEEYTLLKEAAEDWMLTNMQMMVKSIRQEMDELHITDVQRVEHLALLMEVLACDENFDPTKLKHDDILKDLETGPLNLLLSTTSINGNLQARVEELRQTQAA